MTPAERALLLAVAKHLYEPLCEKGEAEGYNLYCLTSAVEAEDVTVVKSCETCRYRHIYHGDAPCSVCADNSRRSKLLSHWEPRHD